MDKYAHDAWPARNKRDKDGNYSNGRSLFMHKYKFGGDWADNSNNVHEVDGYQMARDMETSQLGNP
jgi:hypothetical protein